MSTTNELPGCFNCGRTEAEIPTLTWSYQGRPLTACCQCVPTLIHKWEQVVAMLPGRQVEAPDE